jgi:predicted RNA methylase
MKFNKTLLQSVIDMLKAYQGALFDSEVTVHGYTNKKTGQYVAQHQATRRKKLAAPAGKPKALPQLSFFGSPEPKVGAPAPAKPLPSNSQLPSPPSTAKARLAANHSALAVLKSLEQEQRQPTPAEQKTLALYSGTGGIGASINEYYTRRDICEAIWDTLAKAGIGAGSKVLEPSSGVGMFLRTAPQGMHCQAVEMDETSAKIARYLHPECQHHVGSFESFATTNADTFDAVIGNPPFGMRGATLALDKPHRAHAEEYFLEASLDKTREGGIVAMVVPSGVLDRAGSADFREGILCRAELLAVHRLPNTAFDHSQTAVTTDVVVFRKRNLESAHALLALQRNGLSGTASDEPFSTAMTALGVDDRPFVEGKLFLQNDPRCTQHGVLEAGWRSKAGMGNDYTVSGSMEGVASRIQETDLPEPQDSLSLVQVLEQAAALGASDKELKRLRRAALAKPYETDKLGSTKVVDGVTYVLTGNPPRWHIASSNETPPYLIEAQRLGQQIRQFMQSPSESTRPTLAAALDGYVQQHGNPHASTEFMAYSAHDADLHRLLAAVRKDGSYSDLVAGRQEGQVDVHAFAEELSRIKGGFTGNTPAMVWAVQIPSTPKANPTRCSTPTWKAKPA